MDRESGVLRGIKENGSMDFLVYSSKNGYDETVIEKDLFRSSGVCEGFNGLTSLRRGTMKRLRLCLLLVVFLLVACDEFNGNRGQDPRLEVVFSNYAHEEFYLEDFDISMVQFRHVDEEGNVETLYLHEDMLVSDPLVQVGHYTVHARYGELDLYFDVWISQPPSGYLRAHDLHGRHAWQVYRIVEELVV